MVVSFLPAFSKKMAWFLGGLLILSSIYIKSIAQSVSLPSDRGRITVANIPDYYGGPNLKVLRTDAGTPLRAGTAWIWEGDRQEEPFSYYTSLRQKGLNSVRMILFDTWQVEAGYTNTNWNNEDYRNRQLARMERAVNYASANGLYVIINNHNYIPNYNEAYSNALWTFVAPYFANRTHVIYEASNEPMPGIGVNGDMDMGVAGALSSPRLQALKRTFNIIRANAPNTHIMILTPNGISDYGYGTGLGNLAASFAQLPGTVDWNKTSVAYHLYHNDAGVAASFQAANLRNLHARYPGWPSENNFPASVSNSTLGISDNFRSPQFDNDLYVNQTCERLGLGWSMWNINGQVELDRNWPLMYADAVAKNWTWIGDHFTPDTKVPTKPTNLVATSITNNSALLSWTASTDNILVIGYEVFKNGISIASTTTNSFNLTGLTCASTVRITVKAKDLSGNLSISSTVLSITTSSCPTSFVVEAENNYTIVSDVGTNGPIITSSYGASTASNGLIVTLNDIGDEIKIKVNAPVKGLFDIAVRLRSGWYGSPEYFIYNNKYELRVNNVIKNFKLVPGSISSNIDVDTYYGTLKLEGMVLNAGANYLSVKALENWAKVDYVKAELIADTTSPNIPVGLRASEITGSGFKISWKASTDNLGVKAYQVFKDGAIIGSTSKLFFYVTGLDCGTNSLMTIKAMDAAGNISLASNSLSVSTQPLTDAGDIFGFEALCVGSKDSLASNGMQGGTWISSHPEIATIDSSGIVTGVSGGAATISYTVSANGCTSTDTFSVAIHELPDAGNISGINSIVVGNQSTFTTSGVIGGIWSSSNVAVAQISEEGEVYGLSTGTSSITYTVSNNGCSNSSITNILVEPAITTSIIIRARSVNNPGASFRIEIMSNSEATGTNVLQKSSDFNNLPTNFEDYTFIASGNINPNQIRVRYLNDLNLYDFESDYISVNGITYQTEAPSTYSVGFWDAVKGCDNAGFLSNTIIHCNGYFHYLASPAISEIVVRARSVNNPGASFKIEIMNDSNPKGSNVLQQSPDFNNLPTNFENYSFTTPGSINPNQIRIRYFNDLLPYDFEADYIVINGITYQTEAASTYSIGLWEPVNSCNNSGFLSNSIIHCNGYFHFAADQIQNLPKYSSQIVWDEILHIFPNPAKDQLTVNFNSDKNQQVMINFNGSNGYLASSVKFIVNKGKNTFTIPINHLSPGLFLVTLQADDKRLISKLIVF